MNNDTEQKQHSGIFRIFRLLVKTLLPVIIIIAGVIIARHFISTAPKAERKARPQMTTLVEVMSATQGTHQVMLSMMGIVEPAREVELYPQVSGEIIDVSPRFAPGELFSLNDVLVQVDTQDYALAVVRAEATVAQMYKEHQLELGEHKIGQYFWNQIMERGDTNELQRQLTLREPQLLSAAAAVRSAQASLHEARLNVQRTTVKAPFNLSIIDKNCDKGTHVTPSTRIATVAGTDEYWVRVTFGIDRLKWLFDEHGYTVTGMNIKVRYPNDEAGDFVWPAHMKGLLSNVEIDGRMARALLIVKDPLGIQSQERERPPLLIGSRVVVQIQARGVKNSIQIPRSALHSDDTVWIMSPDNTLDIRKVNVVWRGREEIIITDGVRTGTRIIISSLSTPVKGMPLEDKNTIEAASTEDREPATRDATHGTQ